MKTVSIQDIPRNAGEGVIIDVRTPAEHAEAHLQRAHDHVPLDTLDPQDFMLRRGLDKDASIYILCRSGGRASTAAQKFTSEGFTNVYVIEGGILSAEAYGEPIVKNEAANDTGPAINVEKAKNALNGLYGKLALFSIEQQVMIIVGSAIVISMLLGFAGAEIFYIIPLLLGAALVFRSVTGQCLAAQLLAKAPWNKGKFCGAEKSGGKACS
jgi:rhodanese-related sulfurtransferase